LFVKINIGAAFQDFVSDVLILEDGTCLTRYKFNHSHPVKINIGAAFQDFVSDVLILEDGMCLTRYEFNHSHPSYTKCQSQLTA
jgi:hypothetical protein